MIVEKNVKDKFILGDWLACTSAATTKQVLLTATRPMKLRIGSWKLAARAGLTNPTFTTAVCCLVLVQEGFTAGSVFVPIGAGVDDIYEPAANVLWADNWIVFDANAGTGPASYHAEWFGDGKVITLMEGDSIYWVAKTDEAVGQLLRCVLTMDILN